MFWELVGDRMMFVRDEFFLSYGHIFGGVKCRICAGCDNFQKAHNLAVIMLSCGATEHNPNYALHDFNSTGRA